MKLLALLLVAPGILEVSNPEGIAFTHRNSPTSQKYLIETMGGCAALLDYNNDGRLDVLFVNGGRLEDPQKMPADFARHTPAYWNRLYRQSDDGSFRDVTEGRGSRRPETRMGWESRAITTTTGSPICTSPTMGANILYRNTGKGGFVDVTAEAGVAAEGWSVSAGFFDYDNDGRLDLFVSRYLDYDLGRNVLCGTPFHAYCRPERYKGTTNLLFHNEGDERFRDVSAASGIGAVTGKGMGVAFNDYDRDGFADVFVSNDLMEQFLFHNKGNGTFEERALEAGVALSEDGKAYSGMGAVFADYDNDGRPDILVTNLAQENWALYRNAGGGQFVSTRLASGLAALVARSSGWGAGFCDFDNDGWKDLFAAQSHVLDNVERIGKWTGRRRQGSSISRF